MSKENICIKYNRTWIIQMIDFIRIQQNKYIF